MADELARYLVGRICAEHAVAPPLSEAELLTVAEQRGAAVLRGHFITWGWYVPWPEPIIFLRHGADAWVLAHELFHHITTENEGYGVVYRFPDFIEDGAEREAELFAWLLCGGG